MTDAASAFLADRLSELDDAALIAVAIIADVVPGVARRAAAGEPILAGDALALFAARGYDPVTRKVIEPFKLGRLDTHIVGMGLFMQMGLNKHNARAAAAAMDTSLSSVSRVRNGLPVSINIIIKACAYIGIHPFGDQCVWVREKAA